MPLLSTFEADINHFDPNRPGAGDDRLPVEFYLGAAKDDAATEKEGRPIFRDSECIRIYVNKDNVIDRPIRDTDKQRWPKQYQVFKATGSSDPGAIGTRLEHWPLMSRAQVEEFKHFKIYTMEQLSTAPDNMGQQIMGFQRLKALAQVVLDAAKGDAPLIKMKSELDKRDGQIAELTGEVRRLTKILDQAAKAGLIPGASE